MKTFKEVTREIKQTVIDQTTCDLCGKTVNGDSWAPGYYDVEDTEVRMEMGSHYPEGRFTETTSFDVCPDCFETKVIPWFESQGAKPTEKRSD